MDYTVTWIQTSFLHKQGWGLKEEEWSSGYLFCTNDARWKFTMRKHQSKFFALSLSCLLVVSIMFMSGAAVAWKGDSPSDPVTDYDELVAAVAAASSGDTIYIEGEFTFDGAVTIDKPLTLCGTGQDDTVLTAASGYRHFVVVGGIEVTFEDMTLVGPPSPSTGASNGGISAIHPDSELHINRCAFTENFEDTGSGGGVSAYTASLTDCAFTGNYCKYNGGGVFGYYLTLTNCVVSDNSSGFWAGGVAAIYELKMSDCTISDNTTAYYGGGVYAVDAEIINCTISGNSAGLSGGGLGGKATLINCTISGNVAGDYGGGLFGNGFILVCCTVTGNIAPDEGGGIRSIDDPVVLGSIVSGNTAGFGPNVCFGLTPGATSWPDAPPTAGNNYSIIGEPVGFSLLEVFGTATPATSALADNGGPTRTIKLPPGSPALDVIPVATTATSWLPATDQRGLPRPTGTGFADVGAYEATYADVATLDTVAGETIADDVTHSGANPTTAKAASITVPNSKSVLALSDIVTTDSNATAELFSNSAFTSSAASLSLVVGSTNHAYIKVTAEDTITILFYDVTVTREDNPPPPTYLLTVSAGAGTGGTVSGSASGNYELGAPISVTATSNADYRFDGWEISGATIIGGNNTNPAVFEMPANEVTLTATWAYIGDVDDNDDDDGDVDSGDAGDTAPRTGDNNVAGLLAMLMAFALGVASLLSWSILQRPQMKHLRK